MWTHRVPQAGRDLRRSLVQEESELSSNHVAKGRVHKAVPAWVFESLQGDDLILVTSSCPQGGQAARDADRLYILSSQARQ